MHTLGEVCCSMPCYIIFGFKIVQYSVHSCLGWCMLVFAMLFYIWFLGLFNVHSYLSWFSQLEVEPVRRVAVTGDPSIAHLPVFPVLT